MDVLTLNDTNIPSSHLGQYVSPSVGELGAIEDQVLTPSLPQ